MSFFKEAGVTVGQSLIHSLAIYQGWGDIFSRVHAEIDRVNKTMPGAKGSDKKARFLADCKIIGIDVLLPVGGYMLDAIISLGLLYIAAANPVAGVIATTIVTDHK